MKPTLKILTQALLISSALAMSLAAPALALSSKKSFSLGSSVHLISSGGLAKDGTYQGGLMITLKPGWKTYWRSPGDAGIPPVISFEKSTNLKSAKILWPAPKVEDDGYSQSIVYKEHTVLPIIVTPKNPAQPVGLKMSMTYGVCEQVCAPAKAEASLPFTPAQAVDKPVETLLRAARQSVPQHVAKDAGHIHALSHAKNDDGSPRLDLALALKPHEEVTVLPEGPEGWFFSPATAIADKAGKVTVPLLYDYFGAPLTKAKAMRLTILTKSRQIVQTWHIPAMAK